MIDIHAHILPGMDDGPTTLDQSLEMARIAVGDGIQTMIATPHCLNGLHVNWRPNILSACTEFNSILKNHQIPLKVLPGSEARLSPEIIEEIENGRLMTLNDTGRYFFLELPDQFVPEAVIKLIAHLKKDKITPIITHPERNMSIQHDRELLSDFISSGALSQVTAASLTGGFGQYIYKCSQRIIEMGTAHFVASDAHSPMGRSPKLSTAFEKLSSIIGNTRAKKIMFESPQAILDGRDI